MYGKENMELAFYIRTCVCLCEYHVMFYGAEYHVCRRFALSL